MKFQDQASGGSRTGRGRRVATSLSEINVVPLVDVMLVLLIIFMVTAPMIQRGIEVNLPVARRAQPIEAENIEVTIPLGYRRDRKLYLGADLFTAAVVQERVRQKMEGATKKDVTLKGDREINLGEMAEVTDLLKAAGVEHVGFVTKAPDR